jgi:protein SCO1
MRRLILIVVLLLAAAGLFLLVPHPAPVPPPTRATLLPTPRALPPVTFEAADGTALESPRLAGRWHLVYLGYTSCPDLCPTTLTTLAQAARAVGGAAAPEVLFVAVDRSRDAAHLAEYAAHFGPQVRAVTGPSATLTPWVHALGGYFRIPEQADPARGYAVEHSVHVFLTDPDNRLVGVFAPPHDAATIAEDVRRIERKDPSR